MRSSTEQRRRLCRVSGDRRGVARPARRDGGLHLGRHDGRRASLGSLHGSAGFVRPTDPFRPSRYRALGSRLAEHSADARTVGRGHDRRSGRCRVRSARSCWHRPRPVLSGYCLPRLTPIASNQSSWSTALPALSSMSTIPRDCHTKRWRNSLDRRRLLTSATIATFFCRFAPSVAE